MGVIPGKSQVKIRGKVKTCQSAQLQQVNQYTDNLINIEVSSCAYVHNLTDSKFIPKYFSNLSS